MPLKRDAEEIQNHMLGLASNLRLDGNRKWWPNWLFRSDHVENAAKIINSGKLLSRSAAERHSLIVKDSGSPQHIAQLSPGHRDYVRLYFRPRTPTQYANEGIRPNGRIQYGAHMPVPVYLLFSSSLLMCSGVSFTRGCLTSLTQMGSSARFLKDMKFDDIYHDSGVGWVGESNRRSTILNARHSEVLVKNELPLDQVRHIVCRSAAERETLVNLLSRTARSQWLKRVHVDEGRRRLFQKRGTFVQVADLSSRGSRFVFYPNIERNMRGPFSLYIEWRRGDQHRVHRNQDFHVTTEPLQFQFPNPMAKYTVRITLNEDTAYVGQFDDSVASQMVF